MKNRNTAQAQASSRAFAGASRLSGLLLSCNRASRAFILSPLTQSVAHTSPKFLLACAPGLAERQQAILAALSQAMPLHEIEEYLDWLDAEVAPACPVDCTSGRTPAFPARCQENLPSSRGVERFSHI